MKNWIVVLLILMNTTLLFAQSKEDRKKIQGIVSELNQGTPYQINSMTQLDKVEAFPDKKIKLSCTINSTGIDEGSIKLLNEMKPIFIQYLQTDKNFMELKEIGVTVILAFQSRDEKEKAEVYITPEDYNTSVEIEGLNIKEGLEGNLEILLEFVSKQFRKKLPIIDEESEVNVIDCFSLGKTIVYVLELSDSIITVFSKEELHEIMTWYLKQAIQNDELLKSFISRGASFKYVYKDKKGNIFFEILINSGNLE